MTTARRFAFITPNYHPLTCGVGDFSMRLAQELRRRGMETLILSHDPTARHPAGPDVPVVSAGGRTPMMIAAGLRREMDAFQPTDVVIQYTPQMLGASRFGSPATLWLAQAARRAGRNVVLVAHELFLPWRRRLDLAAGAATQRGQLALLMKLSHRVLVTMETRLAEIEPLKKLVGVHGSTGVVRIGTPALPLPRVSQKGRLRMGVFSTLASTKRFDVVLDCFAVVHARHPHAELVLLGDLGQPSDRRVRALHESVAKHPARDRIRMPGKLDLDEVSREVAQMDVYVFPMISGANTRTSTLPLALGTGVPSLAIRGYETDDLFVDRENILFAHELTGGSFGRAALTLVENPPLAERIAKGGRALYEAHLSWNVIADRFLEQI